MNAIKLFTDPESTPLLHIDVDSEISELIQEHENLIIILGCSEQGHILYSTHVFESKSSKETQND